MNTIFVYGTLKPGGRYWPRFCAERVCSVQPAKVNGVLYDLHLGYPGLKLGGNRWVEGVLLDFPRNADLARIDALEGFDPSRPTSENEYVRLKVPCFTLSGEPFGEHWIYEITDSVLQATAGTEIVEGVWTTDRER